MKLALMLMVCGLSALSAQTHTISAGVVIDGRGNVALNQTIQVEAGKFAKIGTSDARPDIDLSSDTVMPGWIGACLPVSDSDSLIDAETKAYRLLKSGFTTVIAPSLQLRDLIDNHRWAGPRILSHGDCVAAENLFSAAREGAPLTAEALANVTFRGAEALGIADRTGMIAPGMIADLVATKGNPLVEGSALRAIVFVMKDGHIYREPEEPKRLKLIRRY
jgi:adenine deaminase